MLDNPHPILADIRTNILNIYQKVEDTGYCEGLSHRVMSITTLIQHLCSVHADYLFSTVLIKNDTYNFSAQFAVESAIIAELVCRSKGWCKEKRLNIVNAALTMNIGAISLHNENHYEGGMLSQDKLKLLDDHPIESVKVLKANGVNDKQWLLAVYQHHESKDGSGYPAGISEAKICDGAKALAIVDAFVLMTFTDAETNPATPIKILHKLYIKHHKQFDTNILRLFTENNSPYPPGTVNKMSSGRLAIVTQPPRDGIDSIAYYVSDETGMLIDDESYDLVDPTDTVDQTLPIYHDYSDILISNVWGFNRKTPGKEDFREENNETKTSQPIITNIQLTEEEQLKSSAFLDNALSVYLPQNLLRLNRHVASGIFEPAAVNALVAKDGLIKEFYQYSTDKNIGTAYNLPNDFDDYQAKDCVDLSFEYHLYKLSSRDSIKDSLLQVKSESLKLAKIMERLIELIDYKPKIHGYITGLFHNLGMLQLIDKNPDYLQSYKDATDNEIYVQEFENTTFVLNHSLLGAAIVDLFWLPKAIKIATYNQHSKTLNHIDDNNGKTLTACLMLAHNISRTNKKPFIEWNELEADVLSHLALDQATIESIIKDLQM